ncbi:hypothetical protein [Pseudophaeobacter sp.]|uniref:hypothetical protein n=1 Tax=Pseudophaeobacter sp. TaxID=1971739 RepID=UPI004059E5DB
MSDECKSVLELIGTPPHPYEIYAANALSVLPLAAGVALLTKVRRGVTSSGAYVGIISAALYTAVIGVNNVAPEWSSGTIPAQFGTLLLPLLFLGTLFDWLILTVRTRMRPFLPDVIVIALFVAAICLFVANPRYDNHCVSAPVTDLEL